VRVGFDPATAADASDKRSVLGGDAAIGHHQSRVDGDDCEFGSLAHARPWTRAPGNSRSSSEICRRLSAADLPIVEVIANNMGE
jgi:hypothetical protein